MSDSEHPSAAPLRPIKFRLKRKGKTIATWNFDQQDGRIMNAGTNPNNTRPQDDSEQLDGLNLDLSPSVSRPASPEDRSGRLHRRKKRHSFNPLSRPRRRDDDEEAGPSTPPPRPSKRPPSPWSLNRLIDSRPARKTRELLSSVSRRIRTPSPQREEGTLIPTEPNTPAPQPPAPLPPASALWEARESGGTYFYDADIEEGEIVEDWGQEGYMACEEDEEEDEVAAPQLASVDLPAMEELTVSNEKPEHRADYWQDASSEPDVSAQLFRVLDGVDDMPENAGGGAPTQPNSPAHFAHSRALPVEDVAGDATSADHNGLIPTEPNTPTLRPREALIADRTEQISKLVEELALAYSSHPEAENEIKTPAPQRPTPPPPSSLLLSVHEAPRDDTPDPLYVRTEGSEDTLYVRETTGTDIVDSLDVPSLTISPPTPPPHPAQTTPPPPTVPPWDVPEPAPWNTTFQPPAIIEKHHVPEMAGTWFQAPGGSWTSTNPNKHETPLPSLPIPPSATTTIPTMFPHNVPIVPPPPPFVIFAARDVAMPSFELDMAMDVDVAPATTHTSRRSSRPRRHISWRRRTTHNVARIGSTHRPPLQKRVVVCPPTSPHRRRVWTSRHNAAVRQRRDMQSKRRLVRAAVAVRRARMAHARRLRGANAPIPTATADAPGYESDGDYDMDYYSHVAAPIPSGVRMVHDGPDEDIVLRDAGVPEVASSTYCSAPQPPVANADPAARYLAAATPALQRPQAPRAEVVSATSTSPLPSSQPSAPPSLDATPTLPAQHPTDATSTPAAPSILTDVRDAPAVVADATSAPEATREPSAPASPAPSPSVPVPAPAVAVQSPVFDCLAAPQAAPTPQGDDNDDDPSQWEVVVAPLPRAAPAVPAAPTGEVMGEPAVCTEPSVSSAAEASTATTSVAPAPSTGAPNGGETEKVAALQRLAQASNVSASTKKGGMTPAQRLKAAQQKIIQEALASQTNLGSTDAPLQERTVASSATGKSQARAEPARKERQPAQPDEEEDAREAPPARRLDKGKGRAVDPSSPPPTPQETLSALESDPVPQLDPVIEAAVELGLLSREEVEYNKDADTWSQFASAPAWSQGSRSPPPDKPKAGTSRQHSTPALWNMPAVQVGSFTKGAALSSSRNETREDARPSGMILDDTTGASSAAPPQDMDVAADRSPASPLDWENEDLASSPAARIWQPLEPSPIRATFSPASIPSIEVTPPSPGTASASAESAPPSRSIPSPPAPPSPTAPVPALTAGTLSPFAAPASSSDAPISLDAEDDDEDFPEPLWQRSHNTPSVPREPRVARPLPKRAVRGTAPAPIPISSWSSLSGALGESTLPERTPPVAVSGGTQQLSLADPVLSVSYATSDVRESQNEETPPSPCISLYSEDEEWSARTPAYGVGYDSAASTAHLDAVHSHLQSGFDALVAATTATVDLLLLAASAPPPPPLPVEHEESSMDAVAALLSLANHRDYSSAREPQHSPPVGPVLVQPVLTEDPPAPTPPSVPDEAQHAVDDGMRADPHATRIVNDADVELPVPPAEHDVPSRGGEIIFASSDGEKMCSEDTSAMDMILQGEPRIQTLSDWFDPSPPSGAPDPALALDEDLAAQFDACMESEATTAVEFDVHMVSTGDPPPTSTEMILDAETSADEEQDSSDWMLGLIDTLPESVEGPPPPHAGPHDVHVVEGILVDLSEITPDDEEMHMFAVGATGGPDSELTPPDSCSLPAAPASPSDVSPSPAASPDDQGPPSAAVVDTEVHVEDTEPVEVVEVAEVDNVPAVENVSEGPAEPAELISASASDVESVAAADLQKAGEAGAEVDEPDRPVEAVPGVEESVNAEGVKDMAAPGEVPVEVGSPPEGESETPAVKGGASEALVDAAAEVPKATEVLEDEVDSRTQSQASAPEESEDGPSTREKSAGAAATRTAQVFEPPPESTAESAAVSGPQHADAPIPEVTADGEQHTDPQEPSVAQDSADVVETAIPLDATEHRGPAQAAEPTEVHTSLPLDAPSRPLPSHISEESASPALSPSQTSPTSPLRAARVRSPRDPISRAVSHYIRGSPPPCWCERRAPYLQYPRAVRMARTRGSRKKRRDEIEALPPALLSADTAILRSREEMKSEDDLVPHLPVSKPLPWFKRSPEPASPLLVALELLPRPAQEVARPPPPRPREQPRPVPPRPREQARPPPPPPRQEVRPPPRTGLPPLRTSLFAGISEDLLGRYRAAPFSGFRPGLFTATEPRASGHIAKEKWRKDREARLGPGEERAGTRDGEEDRKSRRKKGKNRAAESHGASSVRNDVPRPEDTHRPPPERGGDGDGPGPEGESSMPSPSSAGPSNAVRPQVARRAQRAAPSTEIVDVALAEAAAMESVVVVLSWICVSVYGPRLLLPALGRAADFAVRLYRS